MTDTLKERLLRYRWLRVLARALQAYNDHGCVHMTGALSFYAVVSLIPLAFLAFWLLTVMIGSKPQALVYLQNLLAQYLLPQAADAITNRVRESAGVEPLALLGAWWGLLAFAWSGVRFYESLHHVLTTAWGGAVSRPFLQRKAWTLLAFVCAGAFFGLSILLTTVVTTVGKLEQYLLGISLHQIWVVIAHTLPWLFSIAMMFLLYKFMPNTFVPWRLALAAAVPVGLLWELSKRVFTSLVVGTGFFSTIYGSMAGFVLLMVWIYCASVIILFGAEYAAAWQRESSDSDTEASS